MTVHPVLDCEDFGVDDLDFLLGVFRDGPTLPVGVVAELLQAGSRVGDLEEGTRPVGVVAEVLQAGSGVGDLEEGTVAF